QADERLGDLRIVGSAVARAGRHDRSGLVLRRTRDSVLSGKPGTLLCPAPLRTGRASFPASGSSKPWWLVGGQKRWAAAVGVPGGPPGRGLVRVAEPGPLVGEPPQVLVELVEDLGRYVRPVVVGPAPDDRVEPADHRSGVESSQGSQLGAEPFPDPSDGRLAR